MGLLRRQLGTFSRPDRKGKCVTWSIVRRLPSPIFVFGLSRPNAVCSDRLGHVFPFQISEPPKPALRSTWPFPTHHRSKPQVCPRVSESLDWTLALRLPTLNSNF